MSLEAFIVDEAIVSVFPVDTNGNAIVGSAIYLGRVATGLRLSSEAVGIVDHPTGVQYGQRHIIDETHRIELDRTWVVDVPVVTPPSGDIGVSLVEGTNPTNGKDYRMQRDRQYIVTIVWQNFEDLTRFHYRVYYGVTDVSHDVGASGGADQAFDSVLVWSAQYYID